MAKKENKDIKRNNSSMRAELKKVTWPTGKELFKSTLAVLTIIFIVVLVIFISDTIFTIGTKKLTNTVKVRQEKVKEENKNEKVKSDVKVENKDKENQEKQEENKQEETNNENK